MSTENKQERPVDKRLMDVRSRKVEFFPDMDESDNYGPCALVLHFHKPNANRFLTMNEIDKQRCVSLIADFEKSLARMKQLIIDTYE